MHEEKELQKTQQSTIDSGAYEIIRKRLHLQKEILTDKLRALNHARKEVFNAAGFVLKDNQRIDTDNACVARGIIALDNICIFGYNVHFGLRTEIRLEDVFSIYLFENNQFIRQPLDLINDPNFVTDYENLYRYYRDSIFARFRRTEHYLYMIFQTGKNKEDLKAFKWLIRDGRLFYQDDRSIHEAKGPDQFEFQWTRTGLEDRRLGKFPHISVQEKVFIEAIHGDITFKIENNTDTGKGIYSEKVTNLDQQLDDAEYYYADLGNLIAIRIKPYQEDFRAYVFNVRTKEVVNLPSLNESAILLPDNQGIIFSNGYYLQNGTHKTFDVHLSNVQFIRKIASPNGEDFLYIFTQTETNTYILMSYNIIQQMVETPVICNGFTIFNDGSLIYFRTEPEAIRHHQVQIWETPYMLSLKENQSRKDDPVYKVGNKQVVQAMAEIQEVIQLLHKEDSFEGLYEDLLRKTSALLDSYFWINDDALHNPGDPLSKIKEISNAAIDEFIKVQDQRQRADELLQHTEQKLTEQIFAINSTVFQTLDQLVRQLSGIRKLQGEIIDLKSVPYADAQKANNLLEKLSEINTGLSGKTIEFLLRDEALHPYEQLVEDQKKRILDVHKVLDTKEIEEKNTHISGELELLIDILNSLKIADATQTTRIIEKISSIFASLNEVRAQLTRKLNSLKSKETGAEFSAQLTLLEQSVTNYLELSTSAEKTEEYYTRIIVQLEELESKFSEIDEFTLKIADKRDEVIKAFNTRREYLVSQTNKRAGSLEQIGLRVLKNIENKSQTFSSRQEILSFYASDLMIDKIRQLVSELKALHDISKAENIETLLKKSQEDALRILRDKTELYVDGQNIIALGKHKFSVNKQPLSLTLVNKNPDMYFHLTGTSFYRKVTNAEIYEYQDVWNQEFVSETAEVYRAEYLAYKAFLASKQQQNFNAESFITQTVEQHYSEGYIKGVHNADALLIYTSLKSLDEKLGFLRYDSGIRASAQLFWNHLPEEERKKLSSLIQSARTVLKMFPNSIHSQDIIEKIAVLYSQWKTSLDFGEFELKEPAAYLFETFTEHSAFSLSDASDHLKQEFLRFLEDRKSLKVFQEDIRNSQFTLEDRFCLTMNWLHSFIDEHKNHEKYRQYIEETAATLLFPDDAYKLVFAETELTIDGLKGHHAIIENGYLTLNYHLFISKMEDFVMIRIPKYEAFRRLREFLTKEYEKSLKISELEPKVLTSFVRNKLINEVYFPLIGSNLAKQLGTADDQKRTARMGMLLLISPPGYGKTTLMEYLAKTMGLHFVKINGPTIGHSITSIDPAEAKTSGEREELKKINLSFEMADNVMLYLDDIQHLHPEFLQKFISLADGQRKMDGIFEEESKTYDLRGKRFCVVMAGNPYTESGSKFQIPDMLANRADVYNLGDVIGDTEHLFNLSLIENAAIENPYLEKIAGKSLEDFYTLVDFVRSPSEQFPGLERAYQKQETDDFISVLKHMLKIQDTVVSVNKLYIQSAAMQDAYRTEPPFKLQGSYRNMNKLAAQVVPMMNEEEISQLILSHYESESQTLTSDTESNLLRLKLLTGMASIEERNRWEEILSVFKKNNRHSGFAKDDRLLAQFMEFNEHLEGIITAIKSMKQPS